MTAMNKRSSQPIAGPYIPESIPETTERVPTVQTALEPNGLPNGAESRRAETENSGPNPGHPIHSGTTSTSSTNSNANGRQTPPSPSRPHHRSSGTPYTASTQPQNLNAVAEIVVRTTRSASISAAAGQGGLGGGGRPIEPSRSAPNFRQDHNRGKAEEFTTELRDSARRANASTNSFPPKLKVVTNSSGMKTGGGSHQQLPRSAVDSRGAGATPSRRMASSPPEKLRQRRNTTTTAQISNPVVNPSALDCH